MRRLKIFLAKDENFKESALKIKKENKLDVDLICIEDFVLKKGNKIIKDGDIIYFLCNSQLICNVIQEISNKRCYILNKNFFVKNLTKLEIQKTLYNLNIEIPKLVDYKVIKNSDFPLFCKSNEHASITFQVYNQVTLNKFFDKFKKNGFYLEKAIIGEEFKIYYINGIVFGKNQTEIKNICVKISEILNLEMFSADFILRKGKNFIIDVNPAPGFYLSDDARKYILNYLYKLGVNHERELYRTV